MKRLRLVAAVGLFAASAGAAGCGSDGGSSDSGGGGDKPPVRIGAVVSLSGYLAAIDTTVMNGAKLAVKEINASGGAGGHKLVLESRDGASDGGTVLNRANNLMNSGSPPGVLMLGSSSAGAAAIQPVLARNRTPMVTVTVIPEGAEWSFTQLPPVSALASTQLGAVRKLGAKTVGLVVPQTPTGEAIAEAVTANASKYGVEIVATESVDPTATDLAPQLQRLKAEGAEAIVDTLAGPLHLVIAKQMASLNLDVPLIMSTDSTETLHQAAAEYPKSYFIAQPLQLYPMAPTPEFEKADAKYVAAYRKEYGADAPLGYSGNGYDMVKVIAAAVVKAGETSGQGLLDALESIDQQQGVSALYRYTADNHWALPHGAYVIAQFADGKSSIYYNPADSS